MFLVIGCGLLGNSLDGVKGLIWGGGGGGIDWGIDAVVGAGGIFIWIGGEAGTGSNICGGGAGGVVVGLLLLGLSVCGTKRIISFPLVKSKSGWASRYSCNDSLVLNLKSFWINGLHENFWKLWFTPTKWKLCNKIWNTSKHA